MTPVKAASTSQSPQKQTEYSTMAPTPGMRRKNSLGPLRRAHPASGATWNVEVIRGKMTSRCLWHACRATVLGMVLMVLGAGMATIGNNSIWTRLLTLALLTGGFRIGSSTLLHWYFSFPC